MPSEDVDVVTSTRVRKGKSDWSGLQEAPGCRVTTEFTLTIAGGKHTEPVTRQRRQKYDDLLRTVPPPQIFVPDIGVPESRRSESRADYDDKRDRRRNEISYDSKYDGGGTSNQLIAFDSRDDDGSSDRARGRERRGYEEVPRQGELLLVPGGSQRRGNSTTTRYVYDTSRGPSQAGTREPSKEPPKGLPSRTPSRAASKHRPRRIRGEESRRTHRSEKHGHGTERTASDERRLDRRRRRRD